MYVIMVNTMMPATNDVNRPGQNCPSYPDTAYRVASMKAHVIGTPNNINANLYVLAHCQSNGPLTCTQTTICPRKNINKDNAICL